MNLNPQTLIRKIANSRFLMISVLLHVLIVLLFGGTVLFKKFVEPPDFDASGGDFLTATDVTAAPPQEPVQQMPTPSMAVVTPPVTAPSTSLSAIVSMNPTATSFSVPVAPTIAPTVSNNLAEKVAAAPATSAIKAGAMGNLPATMAARGSGKRGATMAQNGGKEASEQAVMNALRWLQKVQNPDGTWGGGSKGAMTGLAMLCYLGHGETPTTSREFGIVTNNGINAMITGGTKSEGRMTFKGPFVGVEKPPSPPAYEHGIGTYALGEAYTMTKDERIPPVLNKAIDIILKGQGPDGGWVYGFTKATPSDTSVSGWQIQALKAYHLTGLPNDAIEPALEASIKNLERVFDPKDGSFGYKRPNEHHKTLTGVGVLCKLFWQGKPDKMARDGLKNIESKDVKYATKDANLYAWYYDTQACFQAQGGAWEKWNRGFQDEIVKNQSPDGSWPPTGGTEIGGMNDPTRLDAQIYRTTLCALMLEVYYRYLPTGKSGSGPAAPSDL